MLGIGHWHALWHVTALRKMNATIVGVWDHDLGRAQDLGREIGCPAYPRVEDVLSGRVAPDLALVTPRPVEAPAVMRTVLDVGVPAFAEKPLGLRADDVRSLAELADQRGSYVSVFFVNRLSPLWDVLRDPDPDDPVVGAHFRICNGPISRYVATGVPWMLDPEQAGGGCLRNLGIHAADAVAQLAGDQPVKVRCASLSHAERHLAVETYGVASLSFGSSSFATIEAGYNHPHQGGSDYEWRVSTRQKYVLDRDDRLLIGDAGGESFVPSSTSAERYDAYVRIGLERLWADREGMTKWGR